MPWAATINPIINIVRAVVRAGLRSTMTALNTVGASRITANTAVAGNAEAIAPHSNPCSQILRPGLSAATGFAAVQNQKHHRQSR